MREGEFRSTLGIYSQAGFAGGVKGFLSVQGIKGVEITAVSSAPFIFTPGRLLVSVTGAAAGMDSTGVKNALLNGRYPNKYFLSRFFTVAITILLPQSHQ